MNKILAIAFAIVSMLAVTGLASADPVVNNEFPICGSQADQTTVILNCTDYVKVPDQQIFTVPGTGSQSVKFQLVWKEGIFQDEVSAFTVDDSTGAIGALHPGDPGYLNAVYQRARIVFGSGVAVSPPTFAPNGMTFNGGDLVVLMLVRTSLSDLVRVNPMNDPSGSTVAYFSMDALNPDHADHLLAWQNSKDGSSQFSFEDWGAVFGDYNDIAFNIAGTVTAADEETLLNGEGTSEDGVVIPTDGGPCGAIAESIATPTASCTVADKCGSGRWGPVTGHAKWMQKLTHLTFWEYDVSLQACLDLKKGAILEFAGQTEIPHNMLSPLWSYDNKPHWTFGLTGPRINTSFARVTDSFTGCPVINIGIICRTVVVTITWEFSIPRGGPFHINRTVVYS